MDICPVCKASELIIEGSCYTCPVCGYSKCEVSFDRRVVYGEEKDIQGASGREEKADT